MPPPKREGIEWRQSSNGRWLLYSDESVWSGYSLRQHNGGYAVLKYEREVDRFTSRTDARLNAEFRASVEHQHVDNMLTTLVN